VLLGPVLLGPVLLGPVLLSPVLHDASSGHALWVVQVHGRRAGDRAFDPRHRDRKALRPYGGHVVADDGALCDNPRRRPDLPLKTAYCCSQFEIALIHNTHHSITQSVRKPHANRLACGLITHRRKNEAELPVLGPRNLHTANKIS
jgi:hypothetical protein